MTSETTHEKHPEVPGYEPPSLFDLGDSEDVIQGGDPNAYNWDGPGGLYYSVAPAD